MDGVDRVVLGVKNRTELAECLAAAEAGSLPADVMERVDEALAARRASWKYRASHVHRSAVVEPPDSAEIQFPVLANQVVAKAVMPLLLDELKPDCLVYLSR